MLANWKQGKRIGVYGKDSDPTVIALHGGPAAYGSPDRIAEELADTFKTYAPWQRESGDIPLSVEVHVEDLKSFIEYLGDMDSLNTIEVDWDQQGFDETWQDERRCQKEGLHPQLFSKITCPVIILHGDHDPHPGKMTYELLKKYMPQLEYKEFKRCGHDPLVEQYAHGEYSAFLKKWLGENIK